MKKLLLLFCICLLTDISAFSESGPPEPLRKFFSDNGRFEVEVRLKGYPDTGPCECVFKDKGSIAWEKELRQVPGLVAVADNGKVVVMANWGWYDEGGYKSLSVYDEKGGLKGEINIEMSISEIGISSDGKYFAVARGGWTDLYRSEPLGLVLSEQGGRQDKTGFSARMNMMIRKFEKGRAAKLSEEKAIKAARKYAQDHGKNIVLYKKIHAKFNPEEGRWDISFMMDPTPPGGFFDIVVDDKTGLVVNFFPGE